MCRQQRLKYTVDKKYLNLCTTRIWSSPFHIRVPKLLVIALVINIFIFLAFLCVLLSPYVMLFSSTIMLAGTSLMLCSSWPASHSVLQYFQALFVMLEFGTCSRVMCCVVPTNTAFPCALFHTFGSQRNFLLFRWWYAPPFSLGSRRWDSADQSIIIGMILQRLLHKL